MVKDLINENPIKSQNDGVQRVSVLVNTSKYWKGDTPTRGVEKVCAPLPYLALHMSSTWLFPNCSLYYKPVMVSKLFPEFCEPF